MQNCLIIDEEDQSAFIEELKGEAKNKGLDIMFFYFNPKNNEWLDFSTHPPKVDENLLKNNLTNIVKKRIDLVLSDYDFKISNLDGFELLKWIRTKKRHTELVLYSGKGDFQNTFISQRFQRSPDEVRKIINSKINEIINRDDRKGVLFNHLTDIRFDTDLLIEEELVKYSNLKFSNSYPTFEGLTIAEIAQCISDGSKKGFDFKKNILELTIAHLIDLEK